jgi:hypothetical protein
MGNLTSKYIKDTYDGLIKLTDETSGVKATLQPLQDGVGNDLPIQVSSTEVVITGSLEGTASYSDNSTSASHALESDTSISASHAVQADNADNATSASYALTASFAENVQDDIYVSGATFYSGTTGNLNLHRTAGESDVVVNLDGRYLTVSAGQSQDLRLDFIEAATASLNNFTASAGPRLDSLESKTGSYATTGSNVFTGEQQINNNLIIQGDLYVSGSETIISSSTLIVGDREIELNANRTVGDAGIIVYDVVSPETTGSLQYDAVENYWKIGQKGSEERVVDVSMTSSMSVLSSSYADNATSASYADVAGSAPAADTALRTIVTGKNVTASPIPKGTPCFVTGSGTSGNLVGLIPADASDPSLMPATVIAGEDINAGAEGEVIVDGFINGVDTSLFQPGQSVYVAVGGGYTNQRPTGSGNLVQKLGNVEKSDLNGSGLIKGPGWYNDIPNIQEGYFWAGDADGVAQAISTGSFARRDEVNTFTENQIINGQLSINPTTNTALNIGSGSQNITFLTNEFGGVSQPTLFFQGSNAYFQASGNFFIENSPGGVGSGSIQIQTNGDFNVNSANYTANSGVVTTNQLRLSGGAGYDLVVTGSANVSSIIDAGTAVRVGDTSGLYSAVNANALASVSTTSGDQMGVTVDNAAYGNTGWSGPGIWVDDPAGTYPVLIGFQDKASWTDGRITLLKNTDISGSLNVTNDINISGTTNTGVINGTQLRLSGGSGLDLVVTGSANISTTLDAGQAVRAGSTSGYFSSINAYAASSVNMGTGDQMGMTVDNAAYGNTGWSGPGLWVDDPAGNYPVLIGFQNKASYTDGTITMLKNTDISGSLNMTGVINADGGISTTTGNLNLNGASGVTVQNDLYVTNNTIYGKDLLLDDPGATTSFLLNPNAFSEYEGQAFRWVEGSK